MNVINEALVSNLDLLKNKLEEIKSTRPCSVTMREVEVTRESGLNSGAAFWDLVEKKQKSEDFKTRYDQLLSDYFHQKNVLEVAIDEAEKQVKIIEALSLINIRV